MYASAPLFTFDCQDTIKKDLKIYMQCSDLKFIKFAFLFNIMMHMWLLSQTVELSLVTSKFKVYLQKCLRPHGSQHIDLATVITFKGKCL